MVPPPASVFVAAVPPWAPMFSVPAGELIVPPFVTASVPALMVVLPE